MWIVRKRGVTLRIDPNLLSDSELEELIGELGVLVQRAAAELLRRRHERFKGERAPRRGEWQEEV